MGTLIHSKTQFYVEVYKENAVFPNFKSKLL